jgi:hypothetical protein
VVEVANDKRELERRQAAERRNHSPESRGKAGHMSHGCASDIEFGNYA